MNSYFTPRMTEHGRVCCSNPENLCPACLAHFGTTRKRQPGDSDALLEWWGRSSVRSTGDGAGDGAGERARAASHDGLVLRTVDDLDPTYDRLVPPDPYAAGLAMRRAQNAHDDRAQR